MNWRDLKLLNCVVGVRVRNALTYGVSWIGEGSPIGGRVERLLDFGPNDPAM